MPRHRSKRASAVTSVRPCTAAVATMKRIRGILVLDLDAAAGERYINGERSLCDRGNRHRLAKPAVGIGVERHPAALGKKQSFPHADGGESQLILPGLEGAPCGIAKSVRVEETPQPDVRIEKQPHLLEDFPFREVYHGGNEIAADLP